MPSPKNYQGDRGINYARAAYFGLSLPSHSVAIIKNRGGRSATLPTECDVCKKIITDYPFISKHTNYRKDHLGRRRKYHLTCALRIGLVSLVPAKASQ